MWQMPITIMGAKMTDLLSRQRKYTLAWFFSITTTLALFFGVLDGGAYVASLGLILGLYNAANVVQKRDAK